MGGGDELENAVHRSAPCFVFVWLSCHPAPLQQPRQEEGEKLGCRSGVGRSVCRSGRRLVVQNASTIMRVRCVCSILFLRFPRPLPSNSLCEHYYGKIRFRGNGINAVMIYMPCVSLRECYIDPCLRASPWLRCMFKWFCVIILIFLCQ